MSAIFLAVVFLASALVCLVYAFANYSTLSTKSVNALYYVGLFALAMFLGCVMAAEFC